MFSKKNLNVKFCIPITFLVFELRVTSHAKNDKKFSPLINRNAFKMFKKS